MHARKFGGSLPVPRAPPSIEATAADEQDHQLQLRGVTCNHDGNGHGQSAHDGHDAGRCIKVGAASAVGSSEQGER